MDAIDAYWSEGFPHVEGWVLDPQRIYLKQIDALQREAGIRGHVAEIGVFHGKFLLALASLLDSRRMGAPTSTTITSRPTAAH